MLSSYIMFVVLQSIPPRCQMIYHAVQGHRKSHVPSGETILGISINSLRPVVNGQYLI